MASSMSWLMYAILSAQRTTLPSRVSAQGALSEWQRIRTPYQRDRDKIIHCNAFRRLMYKTQVFLFPQGDHYHEGGDQGGDALAFRLAQANLGLPGEVKQKEKWPNHSQRCGQT